MYDPTAGLYTGAPATTAEQLTYVSPTGSGGAAPLTPVEPDWGKPDNRYDDAFQGYTLAQSPAGWQGSAYGEDWMPR